MNTPLPRDTTIQKLDQICRWKDELPDAHAELLGLQSTWQIGSLRGSTAEDALPYGLGEIFDDVDTLGPSGVRTQQGVTEMLESLASMVSGHTGLECSNPYLLREVLWMFSEQYWHAWVEWPTFTEELSQTHSVVARLCGRSAATVRLCPECGGTIKVRMTDQGRADTGKCTGCGERYDLAASDWEAKLLERLRSPEISRAVLVTREQVKSIWPRLRSDLLRKWVERHTVAKSEKRYVLADINARLCYCHA